MLGTHKALEINCLPAARGMRNANYILNLEVGARRR